MNPATLAFPSNPKTQGEHIRRRRIELGWTQKRAAAELGIAEETLCDWELGKMEPKLTKLVRIARFRGYEPSVEQFDAPGLIASIQRASGLTLGGLAREIGASPDTLANLRKGRYQPSRKTYLKLRTFADTLDTLIEPCPPVPSPKNSSRPRKISATRSTSSPSPTL